MAELTLLFDEIITKLEIPTQSCVLTFHVTTTIGLVEARPCQLILFFSRSREPEAANRSFGIDLSILKEEGRESGSFVKARRARRQCDVF